MTINKNIFFAVLGGLGVVGMAIYDWQSQRLRISVALDTNGQLTLAIENPTKHVVLFEDPRFGGYGRFNWELCAGQEIVARGGKWKRGIDYDPLLPWQSFPEDIWPGGPFKCNLSEYYPELRNEMLLAKANSFLWYCRVWDDTATNWIQASGMAQLK